MSAIVGYTTVYEFYAYPDKCRPRIRYIIIHRSNWVWLPVNVHVWAITLSLMPRDFITIKFIHCWKCRHWVCSEIKPYYTASHHTTADTVYIELPVLLCSIPMPHLPLLFPPTARCWSSLPIRDRDMEVNTECCYIYVKAKLKDRIPV